MLFYFPSAEAAGRHNPAVAVADGKVAGVAGPFSCRVVAKQSKEDTSSWRWISQNGTPDEVIAFLATANLASGSVDLGKIGWRMRDDAFARRVFETLDSRGVFHEGLWLTNLEGRRRIADFRDRVRQLFMRREMRSRLAKELGPSFHCALVDIEPDETDLFEYAEFWPLVNARAHALGGKATIPNETLRQRYRGFLDYLATKSALSAKDRLDAAVYFVAQDRVEEAERMVAGLEAKDVETKMQLDYLRAYFAFSRLEPEKGREIALRYADWPVPRWRDRFRAVIAQADEIAGRGPAAAEKGRDEVASAPSLELSAETAGGETRAIVVRGRNVASATVRAFPTDVEVTFSKDPFGGAGVKAASAFLRPAWEAEVALPGVGAEDAAKVAIPEALRGANLLVEATDGEGRVTASLNVLSGALDLTHLRLDKLLFLALLLLAAVGLLQLFVDQVVPLARRGLDESLDRSSRLVSFLSGAGILAVVAVAGCLFFNPVAEFALEDLLGMKDGAGAYRALDVLLTAVLGAGWLALLLWLSLRVWTRNPAIDAGVDRVSGRWHLMTFVCFVMMSFLLIALANPRGDVQDSFIQKVKFIASHGLYALWIGYGMAYALRFLRDDRRVRAVFVPACAAVALAPLIPVHENYFNFELYDKTSAADMDGHDFGWQFGNYQLRGAPAISEELRDDEEPLPNPCYPPEMGENAVFFGGTDPGRFVPTYMIYSAHVRPDVYLITQNALADKTYLDTMRGLYADAIWMPTEYDNQVAFREYDDRIQREIREGRRDPSDTGGLTHDAQGRVSVNGALAVMEINAIIAKQIFEHNKSLHDFYVEESYAMQWMYPYLTPHVGDPGFAREIPARKSFNKLRSALAGAYRWRGDLRRAETAYRQAQSLYAYSPESSFRLVQDVLVPERRFETATDLLLHLRRLDPNNRNIPVETIADLRDLSRRVEELRPKLDPGPDGQPAITEEELLELIPKALSCGAGDVANRALLAAQTRRGTSRLFPVKLGLVLCDSGRPEQAARFFATVPDLLADPSLSPSDVRTISTALIAANKPAAALSALRPYLRDRGPEDWRAWVQFALASHLLGDENRALTGMEQARRFGGQEAIELMLKSPLAKFLPSPAPRP